MRMLPKVLGLVLATNGLFHCGQFDHEASTKKGSVTAEAFYGLAKVQDSIANGSSLVANTHLGQIAGMSDQGSRAWLGVPFAAP